MCGIFAYVNFHQKRTTKEILTFLINGLRRLEYRGYDSAGVCVDDASGQPVVVRKTGNVQALADVALGSNPAGLSFDREVSDHCGIAHTRWATHGEPCDRNAHPHASLNNEFVVVHNGIMTNFLETKKFLIDKGAVFTSDTDTEVIAVLAKYFYDVHASKGTTVTFLQLVMEVMDVVEGAYALVVKSSHFPGELVACKKGSPLIVGVRREGSVDEGATALRLGEEDASGPMEVFFASDSSAIAEHTKRVVYLDDEDIVHVANGHVGFYNKKRSNFDKLRSEFRDLIQLEIEIETLSKGQYSTFMQKEIFEQPQTVMNSMRGRLHFDTGSVTLGGFTNKTQFLKNARRIMFIACGTSLNACLAVRPLFDELVHVPICVENASDFLDRRPAIFRDDVCIFVSQSGETADTLVALDYVEQRGALLVGFTNTVGSSISHKTHFGAHLNAGPEIGVASTKAFTSQIIVMTLVALLLSADSVSLAPRRSEIINGLGALSSLLSDTLVRVDKQMQDLAQRLKNAKSVLVLGRGYQLATAMEAALKIKELSYIHTEGLNSGELKHGPLALIDEESHVIVMCTKDALIDKARSAVQQIRARKGKPIAILSDADPEIEEAAEVIVRVPQTVDCLQSVINVVPLQLLAMHLAIARGNSVDNPRNLAKSVTTQ